MLSVDEIVNKRKIELGIPVVQTRWGLGGGVVAKKETDREENNEVIKNLLNIIKNRV